MCLLATLLATSEPSSARDRLQDLREPYGRLDGLTVRYISEGVETLRSLKHSRCMHAFGAFACLTVDAPGETLPRHGSCSRSETA
jgi:hypothetical protein